MTRLASILLLCLLITLAPVDSSPWAPPPGSRGYGLTVFEGTRIERFPVTVLGVASRAIGGVDMILVRLEDTALNRYGTGIVAGMSGSPIYVDGRMIGALAYGWAYSQSPIGGVTPLPAMLGAPVDEGHNGGPLHPPLTIGDLRYHSVALGASDRPGVLGMVPVQSLLCTQGLGSRALSYLDEALRPLHLEPVAAGSGGRSTAPIPPVVPGSAVGVQLMSGDLEAAVTGTLTWREDNRILAFGHTMAGLGEVALPLTASYVNTILPSYHRPFKMSSSLGIIGQLESDGLYAVEGRVHAPAEMIPVRLEVQGPTPESRRLYRLKVAQDTRLTHNLIPGALVELLSSGLPPAQEHTATMEVTLKPAGDLPSMTVTTAATGRDLDSRLAGRLSRDLSTLIDSRFGAGKLAGLEARLSVRPGRHSATIVGFTTDRTTYAPGESVQVQVRLQPYGGGESLVHQARLPIPPATPKGSFKIGVVGGNELSDLHAKLGYRPPQPGNLRLALEQLRQQPSGTDLIVAASLPGQEAQLNGQPLPLLPSFLSDMLEGTADSQATVARSLHPVRLQSDLVVEGLEILELKVEAPDRLSARDLPGSPKRPAAKKSEPPDALTNLPGGGKRWEVRTWSQFQEGTFETSGLDALGQVIPAPAVHPLQQRAGAHPWTVLGLPERTVVGWSDGAVTEGDRVLAQLPDPLLLCLAFTGADLLVGTGPWGGLTRIGQDGHVTRSALDVGYIWDLEPTPAGILAACGAPGRLYLIPPDRDPQPLWSTEATHLTSLTTAPDGTVYLTSSGGGIYRLAPGSTAPTLIHTLPDAEPARAEWTPEGLAVTAGDTLYLLDDKGNLRSYQGQDGHLVSLAVDSEASLWAGSARNGAVYRLTGDRWERFTVAPRGGIPALSAVGGRLLACAHQGTLAGLEPGGGTGVYLSPVLDAETPSTWGTLRWSSHPFKTGLVLATRSGASPNPDATWSEWSSPLTIPRGEPIPSPPGRYLQVRASLPAGATLQAFDVSFLPQRPTARAAWRTPAGGERWTGRQTLEWTITGQTTGLDFRILIASESDEWKELKPRAPVKPDALTTELQAAGRNGPHRLKLELYQAGAEAPLQTLVSKTFYLSDTPPSLSWLGHNRGLALRQDALAIVAVEYRQGQGDWRSARPTDGLFDSSREEFTIPLPPGSRVEVRVRDECGQTATLSRTL